LCVCITVTGKNCLLLSDLKVVHFPDFPIEEKPVVTLLYPTDWKEKENIQTLN